jgi:hypothetical protein
VHPGLIIPGADLNQTPGVGIEGPRGERTALKWMQKAIRRPQSWLVLYTHDVRARPSHWGCTPEALNRIIAAGLELGFDIVTFAEGARRAVGV